MRRDRWILHVLGLWALAVVQPVLDVLGRSPEFFVAHRAEAIDVIALLIVLLLALPLGATALVGVAGLAGPRTRLSATVAIVGVLAIVLAAQAARQLGAGTWVHALIPAVIAGTIAALLYARYAGVRVFFTILSAAVLVVPIAFVSREGIFRLVAPDRSGFSPADGRTPGFRPSPVVLLVFDEMPLLSLLDARGRIDPGKYPNLSALAREGIWFRNATTVSDYTRWAVPSILTGRRPRPADIPTAGDHPETLFTFLSETHRLEVLEAATALCPRRLCGDAEGGLRARAAAMASDLAIVAAYVFLTPDLHERLNLPDLSTAWAGFAAAGSSPSQPSPRGWQRHVDVRFRDDRRLIVARFLDSIEAADPQPTFYFLHALLPHQPWHFLPGGQRNASPAPLLSPMRVVSRKDEWEIAQNQQRHLLQVGFVDHAVGRVVSRLKEAGLYDGALIVVTADHGVAITRGQHVRAFSHANAAEIMRIPLIMKFPAGAEPAAVPVEVNDAGQRVSGRNVETIDIAPTVAQALGLRLPWTVEGASLLDPSVPPRGEKRIAFAGARRDRRYDAGGPAIEPLLRRRQRTFEGTDASWAPRSSRHAELIGRRVSDLPVVDSSVTGDLRYSWMYADYDPDAEDIPFEVSGQLYGAQEGTEPAHVAVAVNGVVRSVTRTWTSQPGAWLATPPLEAWRRGPNEVDVFVIEGSPAGPVLARVRRRTSRPDDLNLISGAAAQFWNVKQRGFFRHEGRGGRVFRWARPEASVTVPASGARPRRLLVGIVRAIEPAAVLTISVDGCTLFEGRIPHREWEAALALDGCRLPSDRLTITLKTNVTRPPEKGSRRVGVAVRHIRLETTSPDAAAR